MVENKEMWMEYKKTGNLELREKIIIQYIPLVKYVVGKMIVKFPNNVEYDDLVEHGIIGLLDAISKFDVTKGIKFKTYAVTRIRGSIYDELRSQDWLPRSIRKISKDIQKAYIELEQKYNRSATEEEVAEYLDITKKKLNKVLAKVNLGNFSSLDKTVYEGEGKKTSLGELVENKKTISSQEKMEKQELKKALLEKIKELPKKEKMVITLYYYEDLTLKEIGEILDVSESRVSQIHSKIVLKLRAKLTKDFSKYANLV
ncbi:MAG: FliA/WhiG family RNA polymerase sigma factor [Fusobacteriota bacterium]